MGVSFNNDRCLLKSTQCAMSMFVPLVLGVFLYLGQPAKAQAPLPLVTGEYPPYTGQKLPGGGLSTVLVKAVFKAAGLAEPSIDWQPWLRVYAATRAGKYAAAFPYSHEPGREKDFIYPNPLDTSRRVFLTRKNFPNGITGQWHRLRVCNPQGWKMSRLQKFIETFNMTVLRPNSMKTCLRMVQGERADLVSADELALLHIMKEIFGKSDALVKSKHGQQLNHNLFFIISRKWPGHKELRKKFNAGLAALHASGEYERLKAEYIKENL